VSNAPRVLDSRRVVDLTLAAFLLAAASPAMIVISIWIWTTSRGPVLHRARRVGRNGQHFTLYKFRSMQVGAEAQGPGVTALRDPRITSLGKVLRKTKLDELPQLWNVLRGDMSIVGPRPEDPRYVAIYTDAQRQILRWRPGITSPASVTYRDEETILAGAEDLEIAYARIMDEKIRIDLAYFEHATLRGDLYWMFRTVGAIVHR
jgi:lipopolysaccharide/colanic/teichoic acid biosynthesis glycosyltransferase